MRSPSKVSPDNRQALAAPRKADTASVPKTFGTTLRVMMAKLERSWPVSMAVLLLAMIVAAHV